VKYVFTLALLGAFAAWMPVVAGAQTATVTAGAGASATAQLTAKIVAIDRDARIVTLQDAQGNVQSVKCGPDVTRFDALNVGDTVTFQYRESIAYAIAKPGTTAPTSPSVAAVTRAPGAKPGGTITQTVTALVTIQAIDAATPSVTVKTQDGHVITLLVNDKASLAGLNAGDVVQITYTQALAISVK